MYWRVETHKPVFYGRKVIQSLRDKSEERITKDVDEDEEENEEAIGATSKCNSWLRTALVK